MKAADLYLRYIAEFVDRGATRAVLSSQQQVRRGAAETTAALRATSRQVAASGTVVERVTARQQKEWAQAASAARRADRETARYAINASTTVPRSAVRQAEALRRAGDSYEQIARRMRDHGHTAVQTAAVVERAAAREGRAAAATARARQASAQAISQVKAVAGLGVALGFGAAVRDTVAFDRSMRNVNSIAQLSEKQLGGLQKRVLALAGPTAQAPKTLADGLYDLVSSGFKADDAMTVLASSAKAATAGLTTTEVSTKAVAAVINAYHLNAKDAAAVSDTLFQTVNRGVLTFEDLAQNVGDVLPFATTLGVSFRQVGAAISTMTKEGISAPETVTRIKQAMVSFIKPSEGMKAALKGLGVASGEQLIKQKGFQGALEAVIGTTNGSKEAIAKLFPDVRGLGGALALTGKNAKAAHGDLDAFRTGVKGATDRALAQQSKSLAYQWQQMKASAQAVGITIGQTLLPPLSKAFVFFRQHPMITKVAAALVAVGVAAKAIRFTAALLGVSQLLGGLGTIAGRWRDIAAAAKTAGVAQRGAAVVGAAVPSAAGAAGAVAGAASAAAPIVGLAALSAGAVVAMNKLGDFATGLAKKIGPVAEVIVAVGKVANAVVNPVGRLAFMFNAAKTAIGNTGAIGRTVSSAFRAIGQAASSVAGAVAAAGRAVGGAFMGIVRAAAGIAAKIGRAVAPVVNVVAGIYRRAGQVWLAIWMNTVGRLYALAASVAVGIGRAIGSVVGKVVGVARRMVGGFLSVERTLIGGAGNVMGSVIGAIVRVARPVVGRVAAIAKGIGGTIAGALRAAVGVVAGPAKAVAGAISGAFKSIVGTISGFVRAAVSAVVGTINTVIRAINSLPSIDTPFGNVGIPKIPEINTGGGGRGSPFTQRRIGGGHRPARGRRGGILGTIGFRRYQQGGLVPAMVSPGEVVVHQGRAAMVPGAPVAADSVAAMLPVGAAVITGHGQQLLAQGATISEAVARQAPHFATGGHVRGRLSWFGGPHDSGDSGHTALGLTTATPGVAIRAGATWQEGRATLGRYWRVRTPNGRTAVLRQTDLGPNQSTGRRIDITYSALGRLGYTEGNFPTDRIGVADLVGGPASSKGAAGSSYRVSGYAQALARRVGRSRIRSGILPDAFDQGFAQGEAGMTRARLRALGDPVYRAISAAYRVPGDRIVRVAGRPAPAGSSGGGGRGGVLTRGIRATANRIARQWNVNGRVAEIAALAMQAFPGVTVSSGFRPGAITKNGNRSNHGFHRALDLAATGRRNLALGAWLRRRFPPSFRGVTEGIFDAQHDPTGQHGTHVHVAASGGFFNRYRRGGTIGRFQTGGRMPRYTYATPGERGTTIRGDEFGVYNQPSRGFGSRLGGAMFPVVRASNEAFAKRFAALNRAIQDAAADKIAALRRGLVGAVRRGGSELAVKRMQQAIDLIDRELSRRAGLISRRIAARTAGAEQRVTRTDIGLRIRGVDPESAQGITERLGAERFRGDALHRTARDLDKQLRLAEKARNLAKITEIRQSIADNQTAILESRASQAELGRARAEAQKSARLAFAQRLTDIAASRTSLAQTGLQGIELTQRLAGTYDTGGQQRADYIRSAIIPDLQAEQAGIRAQGIEAMRQNNADLARQLTQAYAEKQNEILQAQLDVQEATAQNTEQTVDALKQLGGNLAFEFQGSRLTDALAASGVGL